MALSLTAKVVISGENNFRKSRLPFHPRPDIFTREKRSAVIARIRGTGNKDTELRLIILMRAARITGWRRNSTLTGKPDFIFPKLRLAVFVDGSLIHGIKPKQNAEFWLTKIAKNKARDRFVTRTLRKAGWRVLRIWEHELTRKNQPRLLRRLQRHLMASA